MELLKGVRLDPGRHVKSRKKMVVDSEDPDLTLPSMAFSKSPRVQDNKQWTLRGRPCVHFQAQTRAPLLLQEASSKGASSL